MRYVKSLPGSRGQRILAAALLLLILATILGAPSRLSRTYQSGSSVVLLASRAAARANGGNPYLSFTPSLTLTAELISQELTSPAIAKRLAARGVTGSHTVTLASYGTSMTGSVLLVSATGVSRPGVEYSLRAVTAEIRVILSELQAGEKKYDKIQAVTLSIDREPLLSKGAMARSIAMIVGAEVAVAFAVFRILVALARRRRQLASLTAVAAADYVLADRKPMSPRVAGEGARN